MKKIIFATLAVVAIASCAKQDNSESQAAEAQEIRFTSGIESRVSGDEWEVGDMIGVCCLKGEELTYDNIAYAADNGGTATSFTVAEGSDPIYAPIATSYSLSLFAYYPYFEQASYGGYLAFDITDQSDLGALDFIYSTASVDQDDIATGVAFTFTHAHTLVKLNIKVEESISSLDGFSYSLTNIQTAGAIEFNGEQDGDYPDLIEYGTISSAPIVMADDKKSASIEMILFPTDSTDATLTVTLEGIPYTIAFQTTLYSGKQQSYTLSLGQGGITIDESSITPWEEYIEETVVDPDDTSDAEPNGPEQLYPGIDL